MVMKTAVSVPDDVFQEAEEAAQALGWNRSQLYSRAVREFLDRRGPDPVTQAVNAVVEDAEGGPAPNVGRALIQAGAWQW